MNGVLVVDKPAGPTSHDVVAQVRRAIGISRIGHTGTLDPLATGVLPLVVGRATRLAQFLTASDKEYIADITLGAVSETYDAEGPLRPTATGPFTCGQPQRLEAVLAEFRGTHWQIPPPYSAKKIAGTPAYRLARRHKPVELRPVAVTVHQLEALDATAEMIRLRLVCSSGFYVRTLAHELGERLGCGAYLSGLRRTRAGAFTLSQAVPLATIEAEGFDGASHLAAIDSLLEELPAVVLDEKGTRRASHGNAVTLGHLTGSGAAVAAVPGSRVRLLDQAGRLLAIAEWQAGALLHPAIVLV
jgi:tRNA pseudouridine55 synthase